MRGGRRARGSRCVQPEPTRPRRDAVQRRDAARAANGSATARRASSPVHELHAEPGRRPRRSRTPARPRARDYDRAVNCEHVLVVGAGQMGGGIAQTFAASGRRVSLHDPFPGATDQALATMEKSLTRLAEKGAELDPAEVLARVEPVDDLVAGRPDGRGGRRGRGREAGDLPPRRRGAPAPRRSSRRTPPRSRSPRSPPSTARPDKVIGMHFFNPVPVMALVEVVRHPDTSDETARGRRRARARSSARRRREANDFPGFVSNRILMPYLNEAVWALHDGVAEPEAIDTIAKLGFNHPMGPLALADLIGLDTCVAIIEVLAATASATTATHRAHCCASTSPRAAWAASPGRVSTRTDVGQGHCEIRTQSKGPYNPPIVTSGTPVGGRGA